MVFVRSGCSDNDLRRGARPPVTSSSELRNGDIGVAEKEEVGDERPKDEAEAGAFALATDGLCMLLTRPVVLCGEFVAKCALDDDKLALSANAGAVAAVLRVRFRCRSD
jgi:hypothetical protein